MDRSLFTNHLQLENPMRPVQRRPVSKGKSARQFRHKVSRVHGKNMAGAPMRGGWRL